MTSADDTEGAEAPDGSGDCGDLAGLPLRRIPAQARSRLKVLRALRAAEQIAREDGIDALSLPRVAAAAGVSPGALHQYLPDREAISRALAARYHGRIEKLLDDAVVTALAEPRADPVGTLVAQVAQVYREEAPLRALRAASTALPADDAERQAHKTRMVAKVARLLEAAGATGPSVPAMARVVFTSADAVLHEALGSTDTTSSDDVLTALQAMLGSYLSHHLPQRLPSHLPMNQPAPPTHTPREDTAS